MSAIELELCFVCGEPTGGAGKYEDSLYVGDLGPFCEWHFDVATKDAELAALRALNAEAMEMLRTLEWHKHYEDVQVCQSCFGIKSYGGHKPDCKLNALLQRTTSEGSHP